MSLLIVIIILALIFDYINGFHDSANSIATIVATRVLKPVQAVLWAAFFNLVAACTLGTGVASSISKDYVDASIVTPHLVFAGLTGAIIWNLATWWLGLPSSSSHALIGGYAGSLMLNRVNEKLLRIFVVCIGTALTIGLFLRAP